MPLLALQTNLPLSESDCARIAKAASVQIAKLLGKPEPYVMIRIEPEQTLLFGGSTQPCAYLELKSIGLPRDQTSELSAALCEFIAEQAAIPRERIYIEFADAERTMWGWNGATF
jgi:phenylpyruvate tautomerase PptA (4-oxalocrotonate tautomerase family)